jgi:hypothetical protein
MEMQEESGENDEADIEEEEVGEEQLVETEEEEE